MLVDVVELRHKGEKLPREVVRSAIPLRARLSLDEGRARQRESERRPLLMAGLVAPGTTAWLVPPLEHAWVRCIRDGSMLIVGTQQITHSGRDRDLQTFSQAWWCRVVNDGPSKIATPRSTRNGAVLA